MKRVKGLVVLSVIFMMLVFSGCGGPNSNGAMFRANLHHTGVYNEEGVKKNPELKWKFETRNSNTTSPIENDGIIYFGSQDGHFYAIEENTGEEKWKVNVGPLQSDFTNAAVAGNLVYFARGHYFYALNKKTGQKIWDYKISDNCSSPVISRGVVYFGGGHYLLALDAKTGEEIWKYEVDGGISCPPAINNGRVYFNSNSGKWFAPDASTYLYAINAENSALKWKFSHAGSGITPVISKDTIYCGDDKGNLYLIRIENGEKIKEFNFQNAIKSITLPHKSIIVSTYKKGYLFSLNKDNGKINWKIESNEWLNPPSIADSLIYVTSGEGYLSAIDLNTGEIQWKFYGGWGLSSTPLVKSDAVYFTGCTSHYLFAIQEGK